MAQAGNALAPPQPSARPVAPAAPAAPRAQLPSPAELAAALAHAGLPDDRRDHGVATMTALWEAWASTLQAQMAGDAHINEAQALLRRQELERMGEELSASRARTRAARRDCRRAQRRVEQLQGKLARAQSQGQTADPAILAASLPV